MRDWTKVLLALCVVALGAGMFLQERRLSELETELHSQKSNLVAEAAYSPPVRIAMNDNDSRRLELRYLGAPEAVAVEPAPAPRQPSGVINGVPYYYIPLSR